MLPKPARLLATPIEMLIGDDDAVSAPAAPSRRTRRGPVSRLEQQLERIPRLPKARQRFVTDMLDSVLAQHASAGQEAATA